MISYSVFVESRVAELLLGLNSKERNQLLRLFDKLHNNPFLEGDYVEFDDIGRPMQALIVGKRAIIFWADHAVKEVKILDVRAAGN